MKIIIRSERNFTVIIPNIILLTPLSAMLFTKIITSKYPSFKMAPKEIMRLFDVMKEYKKKYKGWELVNISSSDGDNVIIRF